LDLVAAKAVTAPISVADDPHLDHRCRLRGHRRHSSCRAAFAGAGTSAKSGERRSSRPSRRTEARVAEVELVDEILTGDAKVPQIRHSVERALDLRVTPHFMIADADEPAAIEAGGAHFIVRRGSNRSRRESGERVEVAEEKGPETGAKAKFNQAPHSATPPNHNKNDRTAIGVIGGGKRRLTGVIDIALIQSLVRRGKADDLVVDYSHLIVDECHHVSAASFELAVRRANAKYVLGLSATVARKDGHHPIIFMQCGPVRYRANARSFAAGSGIAHRAEIKVTEFRLPATLDGATRVLICEVFAALAADEARNDMIFDDVLKALEGGRSRLVLTERRDHLGILAQRFSRFTRNLVVLRGGLSKVEREATYATLRQSGEQERLILATGRYLGEGFDDDRLDTLFLTMPISWKGTLAQYVGRLHRRRGGKTDVRVVDYVDRSVPILVRMATKRRAGYKSLGYDILEQPHGNCWHQISSTAGKQEPQRLGPWLTWLTERDSI
jgi:hypothetical protein